MPRFALDDDQPRGSERAGIGHGLQPRELVGAAEQTARHRPSLPTYSAGLDAVAQYDSLPLARATTEQRMFEQIR
jgi:hypothetical protein